MVPFQHIHLIFPPSKTHCPPAPVTKTTRRTFICIKATAVCLALAPATILSSSTSITQPLLHPASSHAVPVRLFPHACRISPRSRSTTRVSVGKMTTRVLLCVLLCLAAQLHGGAAVTSGTANGMERWGFVNVRPKAHMFWWFYQSPQQVTWATTKPWPTIFCMLADLGQASTWFGNFQGVGPLDTNLMPRNSTWLHKANLLFVDHPVGVGYSYVDDKSALATTAEQAASDQEQLLDVVSKEVPALQSSPLFFAIRRSAETSYSASMAAKMAKAVKTGALNLTFGGVLLVVDEDAKLF